MTHALLRYPILAVHYIGQYLKSQLEYRASMLIEVFSYVLWIATDMALIYFVLLPTGTLAGWSLPQMMLLFGMHMASLGLFFTVGVNLFFVPGTYILEGHFDRLLLRPISPYFQLLMERLSVEDVVTVLSGLAVSLWALNEMDIPLSLATILLLCLIIYSGSLVYLGLMTATASLSFWLKDRTGIMQLALMLGDQPSTYPLTIYPPMLRLFFTIGLPLGFIAYYPAHLFFGTDVPGDNLFFLKYLSPLVGSLCLGFGYLCFLRGLKGYESVGS